jgi:hypothetical protein
VLFSTHLLITWATSAWGDREKERLHEELSVWTRVGIEQTGPLNLLKLSFPGPGINKMGKVSTSTKETTMQVTQVQDRVTHAVIGGGKTQSFGIADTAEFFHVLSSTLYSRKEEAMVREIMCNAWDAHIEAGITDKPIKISLDYDQMIIQDFGKGIAPDMIGQIYGTYGGSTKKDNSGVTGGFGLGSKAPFAYVDHFEVTSCHEGTKTIYKMSLSSAMVGGKPSIATIVSVPTTDTGLTVSVRLKDRDDFHTLNNLITNLAATGEILCELNGEKLNMLPFSQTEYGFLLVKTNSLNLDHTRETILVRYGNVVYPIAKHKDYAALYEEAYNFLKKIDFNIRVNHWSRGNEWTLILKADPDTISVTPSRESLSMTEHTINTIFNLLTNFHNCISSKFNSSVVEESNKLISSTWFMGRPGDIFNTKKLPRPNLLNHRNRTDSHDVITNLAELGSSYISVGYPDIDNFSYIDLLSRIDALLTANMGDLRFLRLVRRELKKAGSSHLMTRIHLRKYLWPILRKVMADKSVDNSKLFVYEKQTHQWRDEKLTFTPIAKVAKTTIQDVLSYARNIVIISYNRSDVLERVHKFPVITHWLGEYNNSLVYIVPRNSSKVDAAKAFWSKQGMTVIDLTVAQPWEPKDVIEPLPQFWPSKPKKIGLPLLSAGLTPNGHFSGNLCHDDKAARIEKPEFIVRVPSTTHGMTEFKDENYSTNVSRLITKLYGHVGGVVTNASQHRKFVALGAKPVQDYIFEKLLDAYENNPEIEQYYRWTIIHPYEYNLHSREGFYELLRSDEELRKKFNLPAPISQHSLDLIEINYSIIGRYSRNHYDALKKIDAKIKTWNLNPIVIDLINKIIVSNLTGVIDYNAVKRLLASDDQQKVSPAKKAKIREFILTALEG